MARALRLGQRIRSFAEEAYPDAAKENDHLRRVTKVYRNVGHPAFYFIVLFLEVPFDSFLIGGEPNDKFVRVVSQHIARTMDTYKLNQQTVNMLEEAFGPYVKGRGRNWEIHIEKHSRDTWYTNGIVPPMPGTDAETSSAAANKLLEI
ncbi:hypothetical protein Unana1_00496 [Umbelopsis nana]